MAIKSSSYGNETGSSILGVNQLAGEEIQRLEELKKQLLFEIRCCCPAIIKSINYDNMTVTAQPVIKEKIQFGTLEVKEMVLPEIQDVPLIYLSATDIKITYPISINDECLLFFADTCIDSWWQSGGIQSQFEERRHDISDCFCIPCQMSQPKKIKDFDTKNIEIKNKLGNITITKDKVYLNGKNLLSHKHQVTVDGTTYTTTTPIFSDTIVVD